MPRRPSPTNHLDAVRAKMGTIPDHEVAKMCDSTAAIVGRYRRKHGIKAYQGYKFVKGTQPPGAKSSATKGTRRARKSKLDPFRAEVGKLPDKIVAAKAGVSVEGVRMYRKRHGIALEPGARQPRGRKAKVKVVETPETTVAVAVAVTDIAKPKRRKRRSKIDPFKSQVGVLADKLIAEKAGLSLQAVRQYRRRHNISAPPRGGAAPVVVAATPTPAAAAPAAAAPAAATPAAAAPAAAAPATAAWGYSLSIRNGETEENYFLIATSITDAAQQGANSNRGRILGIRQLGPALR